MVTADDKPNPHRPGILPSGWSNPRPEGRYDLAIVGGSRAGVAAALAGAELGARVALVARDLRYEDNAVRWLTGSLASTAPRLVAAEPPRNGRSSPAKSAANDAAFAEASGRWRRQLASELPLWELLGFGIDVYFGQARFTDPRALEVEALRLDFRRALLAVGPGWASPDSSEPVSVDDLTPATLSLADTLPRRLLVVGHGSQACEIAQAFCRLGSDVHLVTGDEGILPQEDRRAAEWVRQRLAEGGLRIDRGWKISTSSQSGRWKSVVLQRQGQKQELIADQIVAAGEDPLQLAPLDPVAAGIRCGLRGVEINSRLQTANRAIYALGTAAGQDVLEGSATALARLAVRNALQGRHEQAHRLLTGRTTYTDPQLAHVGLTLGQADVSGQAVESRWIEFADSGEPNDCDARGVASVQVAQSGGRLLGLTIAGHHAAVLAAEMSARLCTLRRVEDLADCTATSAGHERAIEQIVAACRRARV